MERWRGRECGGVGKVIVMECTNDVCGMRRVGGERRKSSDGGMKKLVWRLPTREERLRNGYSEMIGLPMTDGQLKLQKE